MRIVTFDLEANGLLDEANVVWCGVAHDGEEIHSFYPHNVKDITSLLDSADVIVGHNIIGYDLPLMRKLWGYDFVGRALDTFVLSCLLQPKRSGGNGLEAWGERVGVAKPVHEVWDTFSEDMLFRCQQDVVINHKILGYLLQEASIDEQELVSIPLYRAT